MYLDQVQSTVLFTAIRLALQTASLLLIAHIASRTNNVTYLERINGGVMAKINYVFFSKFPSGRKHHLGRFFVTLTLITMVLNFLPTLLSKLYPVKPTFLESNQHSFNIPIATVLKATSITPGRTTTKDIALGMGLVLEEHEFSSYTGNPPIALPLCHLATGIIATCVPTKEGAPDIVFRGNSSSPVIAGYNELVPPNAVIRMNTTSAGEMFEFFDAEDNTGDDFALVNMFRAAAIETDFTRQFEVPNGPRSLENCLFRKHRNNRCVRHSLGYLVPPTGWRDGRLYLISRRVAVQTVVEEPKFVYGQKGTLDCKQLSKSNLVAMCQKLVNMESPGRMFSMENYTTVEGTTDGSIHWDVVTTFSSRSIEGYDAKFVEAFSLDIKVEHYNVTFDDGLFGAVTNYSINMPLQVNKQEIFEATYLVPDSVDPNNHTWAEWGFSEKDVENLKGFLFGGTVLNNGTLITTPPSLLADVSSIVVGLLFGVSLLMVVLAFILSHGVPPIVREPLSEILQEVQASHKEDDPSLNPGPTTNALSAFFHKRRVANLILDQQALPDVESDGNSTGTAAMKPQPSVQRRRLALRMEFENDGDDDEVIQLLETTRNENENLSKD
ncbi:hypothetical protein BGW38_004560 [Lunasporangiospora selenospora]|uniref:Uncharacterized protein n=1 Tax=Lunasporangiospora selenospora TaxID=979761 RepID=A0A9P6G287_9FUNG|nr:hypothetical protein BGW38_004560 [Lunasporangiospora selenospora]